MEFLSFKPRISATRISHPPEKNADIYMLLSSGARPEKVYPEDAFAVLVNSATLEPDSIFCPREAMRYYREAQSSRNI